MKRVITISIVIHTCCNYRIDCICMRGTKYIYGNAGNYTCYLGCQCIPMFTLDKGGETILVLYLE